MSKGSRLIVEGNFMNLGTRHGRKKSTDNLSLETKIEALKSKYKSNERDFSTKQISLLSLRQKQNSLA